MRNLFAILGGIGAFYWIGLVAIFLPYSSEDAFALFFAGCMFFLIALTIAYAYENPYHNKKVTFADICVTTFGVFGIAATFVSSMVVFDIVIWAALFLL